jgi:hypothetical protein
VDINPGDRAGECKGLMVPVAVRYDSKREFVITHKCKKCGFTRNNKSQKDDNRDLLIFLTNPYNITE